MRTCEEIYQDMCTAFTNRTGFQMDENADLAVRLYAAAAQIESLYAYCDWVLRQSFPQSATGESLDTHGALRGITRKDGVCARGTLRFTVGEVRADPVTVPAGTVCTTAGLVRFATTKETVIQAGSLYADAPAQAEAPGESGNAPAGTVCHMTQAPAGVTACTNPLAFTGGQGVEDDESLRQRILSSYARLPNGANKAFYEERVLAHEGVGGVTVQPRIKGIGTVGVVVAGSAGAPSEELLQEIRDDLNAVREIAVDVTVSAPKNVTVPITASLKPTPHVSFAQAKLAVESALGAFFSGGRLGKPVYVAELGNLFYETGMVANYHITAPAADLAVSLDQLPVLGTVTLTEEA